MRLIQSHSVETENDLQHHKILIKEANSEAISHTGDIDNIYYAWSYGKTSPDDVLRVRKK